MPSVRRPEPKVFTPVSPTKEDLDYADLPFIDFSLLEQGEQGKAELARTLDNVMRTQGFFYVVNHGLSEEEIQRQVNIGWTILSDTSIEEKQALEGKIQETGQYRGFKLRNYYQYISLGYTIPNGLDYRMELSTRLSNTTGLEI
jgi:isopenicillin N synthase-like dioxygenase